MSESVKFNAPLDTIHVISEAEKKNDFTEKHSGQ